MPSGYQEIAPAARLAPYVECYWSLEAEAAHTQRVLPDGCMDLLVTAAGQIQLVGAMTRYRDFAIHRHDRVFGVRFHPGMSYLFFPIPGSEVVDATVELGAGELGRLAEVELPQDRAVFLDRMLAPRRASGVVQRIAQEIRSSGGQSCVDELATQAGLSARQLRRTCLEQTGLTPKQLCRVVRFRRATGRMSRVRRGDWAGFALDSGYYDQSHLIHEFQDFSGYAPAEYARMLAG